MVEVADPHPRSSGTRRSSGRRGPSSSRRFRRRGIPEFVAERLRFPERAVILTLPVRMDDGTIRSFPAYRVQHSSVLGPTKGGIRYDEGSTSASARRSRCG